jgi:hypothetical protein
VRTQVQRRRLVAAVSAVVLGSLGVLQLAQASSASSIRSASPAGSLSPPEASDHAAAATKPAAASKSAPARISDPTAKLGPNWRESKDVLVSGVGDSAGFHLYLAPENAAYAWKSLATLAAPVAEPGPWTGEVCVTGSGHYAVAVYAPASAANKPALMNAGGLAAVVDLSTGHATEVATGVQLAYFNPACGPSDRVLLTRAIGADMEQTDVLTVDAVAHKVVAVRRVKAQFTTPAPGADGDYGVVHGALVKLGSAGGSRQVAKLSGRPFAVVAGSHGVDVASVDGAQAIVQRYNGSTVRRLGAGPREKVQLFGLPGGRTAAVGEVEQVADAPGLTKVPSQRQVTAVSSQAHLLLEGIQTEQTAQLASNPLSPAQRSDNAPFAATVLATRSARISTVSVTTSAAPTLTQTKVGSSSVHVTAAATAAAINFSSPSCGVPRNDPKVQAFQPSPDMVEWAVDRAVHGTLNVQRPANYLKTGQSAYTPQGMFRPIGLDGTTATIPAQVMLGIVAQESNMSEASWHAVPGDLGNPLIADYYGNAASGYSNNVINYDATDCGYGIAQVTDGMRADSTARTYPQKVAIATDYAANIAAALNILSEKWNQLHNDPAGQSYVNNGDPSWIENWYLALWIYNSGYHPSSLASANHGHYGMGWLNNPANPAYSANRHPFLRDSYDDARTPSHWPYQERVLGWAETPQLKGTPSSNAYAKPDFGPESDGKLTIPDSRVFCSMAVNSCDSSKPRLDTCTPGTSCDPCPAESDACWWHGQADFANCITGYCADEHLSYGSSSPEPGVQRIYDRDCGDFTGLYDSYYDEAQAVRTVFDLNDTTQYALGCSVPPSDGKFTLRLGDPPGSNGAYYGQVDLHQEGAGYKGHAWFTHVIKPNQFDPAYFYKHKVVGTWTPELGLPGGISQRYDVLAHLPSHGGEAGDAHYVVFPDTSDAEAGTCHIDQGTGTPVTNGVDKWVYLGNYNLQRGAHIQLSNEGVYTDNNSVDIAFDAMAFVPIVSSPGHNCKDPYN